MAADFDLAQVPEPARVLFDHSQARIRFHADVFWTKASMAPDILALWLDTYQVGKDFTRRGIVEVILYMIQNDEQLQMAQEAVRNLQRVLLAARKVHSAAEYRAMSAPILLELQQREQEIFAYLSRTEAEVSAG